MDQVDAAHQLRHTMFDLKAGIDLQEVRLSRWRDQELRSRRVAQADRSGDPYPELVDVSSGLGRETGCRRLLQQLLVPPLDRTIPFAQMATMLPYASPSNWTSM